MNGLIGHLGKRYCDITRGRRGGALVGFRYRKSLRLAPGVRLNVTGKAAKKVSAWAMRSSEF